MEDQRPISFVGTTPAGETTEVTHEFDTNGVITGAQVVTHAGQEYDLRNYAEVIRDGSPVTLWEPLGEEFLAGDGEDFDPPLRFEFTEGDVLRLRAENTTTDFEYHHNMTINIDYETSIMDRLAAALGRFL